MSTLSTEFQRFIVHSEFTLIEENRDVIIAKPMDLPLQESMLREARLAGIATEETTIDDLYELFIQEGFHEEMIEEASRRWPMLVREHDVQQ